VKVSSVKRVAEFVDKHPDESVSILRSWLHETA
jgi:flagellar M-ring protein FliF